MGGCTLTTPMQYRCIFCLGKVHGGDEGCTCSTLRQAAFNYQSLCTACAETYDRLMNDEEMQPILRVLLNKEYWRGAGTVVDF